MSAKLAGDSGDLGDFIPGINFGFRPAGQLDKRLIDWMYTAAVDSPLGFDSVRLVFSSLARTAKIHSSTRILPRR